jgi:hypothetical protein
LIGTQRAQEMFKTIFGLKLTQLSLKRHCNQIQRLSVRFTSPVRPLHLKAINDVVSFDSLAEVVIETAIKL